MLRKKGCLADDLQAMMAHCRKIDPPLRQEIFTDRDR
jgi:hypothetical protein